VDVVDRMVVLLEANDQAPDLLAPHVVLLRQAHQVGALVGASLADLLFQEDAYTSLPHDDAGIALPIT
jgi:hypothetical protein